MLAYTLAYYMTDTVTAMIESLQRKGTIQPSDVAACAVAGGFVKARQSGSHASYKKRGYPPVLTIPMRKMGRGTALNLLKKIKQSL